MNFFLCRKPGSCVVYSGYSESLLKGIHKGFVFAPFDLNAEIYTIPALHQSNSIESMDIEQWSKGNEDKFRYKYPFPEFSTPYDTHIRLIENAIEKLRQIEDDQGIIGKIIAARIEIAEYNGKDNTLEEGSHIQATASCSGDRLITVFDRLCSLYPDAFVFLFSTPLSGTWLGASPELLLESDGSIIRTLSLAGTRPADTSDADWDVKNREEQQIVTDFIVRTLTEIGLSVSCGNPHTRHAGNVEHIATDITASLPTFVEAATPEQRHDRISSDCKTDLLLNARQIEKMIRALSPTPALSGFPRKEAIEFIINRESNPRLFYGGMVGLATEGGNKVSAYVNLRSGRHDHTRGFALYAGGGITQKSDPESEWIETHRKIQTLRCAISSFIDH